MTVAQTAVPFDIERFRGYLCVLARQGLRTMVIDAIDEADVVQDVMMHAYRGLAHFRGTTENEMLAWLRTILSRQLLDILRRGRACKRDAARRKSLEAVLNASSHRLESVLANTSLSPSQHAARNEEVLRIAGAMQTLPENQRLAVELHYLQGCAFSEVADRMHVNRNQAAGLIRRGLSNLRKSLGTGEVTTP